MWNRISHEEFSEKIKGGTAVEDLKQQIKGQAAAKIDKSKIPPEHKAQQSAPPPEIPG